MCYCNIIRGFACDICIIACLVGCFFLGWSFGVRHMRHEAVSFNVATYQANENGGPEFVWKNMENK
jgi:hypothetical protein